MHLTNILLLLCAIVYLTSAQMLGTSLKNMTETDKAKPKTKKDDSPLKKEIRKYLRECGADISDEESAEEPETDDNEKQTALWGGEKTEEKKPKGGTYPTNYGQKGKGTYPTSYGSANAEYSDDEEEDCEDEEDSREKGKKGRRKQKYRVAKSAEKFGSADSTFENYRNRNDKQGGNKRKQNDDYDESEEDEDGCEDQNKNKRGNNKNNRNKNNRNNNNGGGGGGNNNNRNRNRNQGNNKRGGYSYGGGRYGEEDGYGSYGRDPYATRYGGGGGGGDDFGLYGGWGYGGRLRRLPYSEIERLSRRKRESEKDEDVQCLSQCVFGYLEMLDDNKVPSETEVMKYFQDNISDSSQRMKTIREARRCFAKLASTDADDGCTFSKSLAKCLNLGIEGKR